MMMRVLVAVLLAAFFCAPSMGQEENEARRAFYRGNDLFEAGDYAGAVEAYSAALESGPRSASLHFNLGNAWLREERPGHAIHQFRRAAELAPRDGDIEANLQVAHERAGLAAPESRTGLLRALFFVHERLTVREALWLFAGLWFAGFFLLHARLVWGRPRGLTIAILLIVLGGGVLASLLIRTQGYGQTPTAIVVAPTAAAWSGRSEETFGKLFELAEGEEVEVLERDDVWMKIAAGERKGYVRRAHVRAL